MTELASILLRRWLKKSVDRDGIKCPVLVSRNGIVLDGNHRVILARQAGTQIPIVRLPVDVEMVDPNTLKTYYD